MSGLESDIYVYALFTDDDSGEYVKYVREYLDEYGRLSDKFHVSFVDPNIDPSFVSKFEADGSDVEQGSVILACGERFKVISFDELYRRDTYTNATSIDMEKKVTSAVINLTDSGGARTVYFTQGHNEYECPYLKEAFSADIFECEDVNLLKEELPQNAALAASCAAAFLWTPEQPEPEHGAADITAFETEGEIKSINIKNESGSFNIVRKDGGGYTIPETADKKLNTSLVNEAAENTKKITAKQAAGKAAAQRLN